MSDCVSCNTAPPPCNCSADQTCVQTPRNCSTCPRNICISSSGDSSGSSHHSSSAGLGAPIGGAIGGLAAGLLIILSAWILYKRNLLPPCFNSIFESTSTKSFSKKHPHHPNNRFKSKSNNNNSNNNNNHHHHHLKSQNEPHHQSVIYLPTDTRDPKTASIIESDDDPFSDKHSGVSIIGAQHKQNQTTNPTLELLSSPTHPSSASAYSPSRTHSISGPEDRNISITADFHPPSNLPSPAEQANPTLLVSHPNSRSSFLPPSLPSPTHSNAIQHRPVRPHRAPDLDLRLPGAAAAGETEEPKPSASADEGPSLGSHLSPDPNSRSIRRLSGSSDATTHDSHLSSILDPAMIVTPVTLVRTASGRQAAVQRVALRGQEKARVVRLPPSAHPHGPSPLSISGANTTRSPPANVRETFGLSPTTPGIGRAYDPEERIHSGQHSPLSNHQAFEFESRSGSTELRASLDPFSDLSTLQVQTQEEEREREEEDSGGGGGGGGGGEGDEGREGLGRLPGESSTSRKSSNLRRARSTAYSIASSSFGGSSVCDSFIEDEEVEFPTVLGRSAATLAQRILQQQHDQHSQAHHQPTSHHHVNLKALGRDRAISLSSIITEEAHRTSRDGSPPPLPSLPTGAGGGSGTTGGGNKNLPEPFKPFAGQKPSRSSRPTEPSHSSLLVGGGGWSSSSCSEHTNSMVRLSSASSVRSGYGSVLEGIPFNIGFCSDPDGLFIDSSSSSSSVHHHHHQHPQLPLLPLPNTPSDLTLRTDIPGRPLSLDILPPLPLAGPAPDEIDGLPPGPQDHHLDLDHFLQPSSPPSNLAPVTPTVIFHPLHSSSSPSPTSDLPPLPLLPTTTSASSSSSSPATTLTPSIPPVVSHPPPPSDSSSGNIHSGDISDSLPSSVASPVAAHTDTHQLIVIDSDTRAALDYLDQL
ncbi:hypothetical protein PGTUg99_004555 [Puccinia graminis f. sp. tritici]|uniref:Membrane anchor Opy2 N-terminal domain-containing protein n=1 Tax=Puccinia graminis f. sp. tritici TaxID=56615 RepID=A0A5B0S5R6_PUCGR|nr:hypothetical protein PGTUg99_004555 [Puccinia graminis f. sp. tritici]